MRLHARSLRWFLPVLVASGACSDRATPETARTTAAATDAPAVVVEPPVVATTEVTVPVAGPMTTVASPPSRDDVGAFPAEVFVDVSPEPASDDAAAKFQAILDDMAAEGAMTATVMSPDGTWSGAAGTADGVRDMRVDDQFFIASITKSFVAAQIMQMVEAGELTLDDFAADHLPADLDFDANQATIRQLLSQRSGIPDYFPLIWDNLSNDRLHRWTTAEVLDVAGEERSPSGTFQYTDTNYVLLGLIIEELRGRPIAQVLRDGALAVEGIPRLVYQPDEKPTEPMAMPNGESTAALELGDGYLPSVASVTAGGPAAAIASDSPSLANWWRAFCAGEIVSQASLTEMTTLREEPGTGSPSGGYGLGLYNVAYPYARAVGHTGVDVGFVSWAGCLPEHAAVVVVLTNRLGDDLGDDDVDGMARPLVDALKSGDTPSNSAGAP